MKCSRQLGIHILLALVAAVPAYSHEIGDPGTRSVRGQKTDTPPVIDGKLDDAVWESVPVLTQFHPAPGDPLALPPWWLEVEGSDWIGRERPWDRRDVEGTGVETGFVETRTDVMAEDQTLVRLTYDDEFVYIAWECIQDRDTINATERKYDRFQARREDYVQVTFDTFHDHGRTYIFLVTPLGTRWDSRDGLFGRNQSWDAEWRAATTIEDDRWYAEMAIPIGVMHHNRDAGEAWGLNFRRRVSRKNDSSHWNYSPDAGFTFRAQGPKFVADFGHLEGLDLSKTKIDREPKIETQGFVEWDKREGSSPATKFGAGMDLGMRLSSHWITNFSINPNFSEVDADAGDIQNRDTPRFLEERRTFFNEGAELFRTPIHLYDSRNVNEIDLAAKITGTGKDWTLASLAITGEGRRSGEANFLVTRYTRNLTDEIQLGTIGIGIDRGNGHNVTAGADARIELGANTIWSTQYMEMFDKKTSDLNGTAPYETRTKTEHAFWTGFEGGSKPFFWFANFRDISDEFLPDLSFIPRDDIVGPELGLRWRDTIDAKFVEGYNLFFNTEYFKNHADDTTLRDFLWEASLEFQNDLDVEFSIREDFHRPYDNRTNQFQFNYMRQDRFRWWHARFSWGEFETVNFEQYDLTKPFKIGERFTHEFTGTFRRESPPLAPDDDVWLWRHVAEYTFVNELRVKLTLQQGSDKSAQQTLLFAYEDVKNWDYFLVLEGFRDPDTLDVFYGVFSKFAYRW